MVWRTGRFEGYDEICEFLTAAALFCCTALLLRPRFYIQGSTEAGFAKAASSPVNQDTNGILVAVDGRGSDQWCGTWSGAGRSRTASPRSSPGVTGVLRRSLACSRGDIRTCSIQPARRSERKHHPLRQRQHGATLVKTNPGLWVPANGLTACPGISPGHPPIGMKGVISGYLVIEDWLGRQQWSVNCG